MGKYDKHLPYVQTNISSLPYDVIAAHIGCPPDAIRQQILRWRKAGLVTGESFYRRKAEIGEVRKRIERGVECDWIKTEKGWQRVYKPKKKAVKKMKEKKVSAKKSIAIKYPKRLAKVVKKYEPRRDDLSKRQAVFIPELRLTVYADKNADPQDVRKKYLEQREFTLKKVS